MGPERRGTRGEQLTGGQVDDPLDPRRQLRVPLRAQGELDVVAGVQRALRQVAVQLDLQSRPAASRSRSGVTRNSGPFFSSLKLRRAAPPPLLSTARTSRISSPTTPAAVSTATSTGCPTRTSRA